MKNLYNKEGGVFALDHEHEGVAYVRPMAKVVGCDDEGNVYDDGDYEPAEYLVAIDRGELFDAPPVEAVNEDIAAKKEELDALKASETKMVREMNAKRTAAERELKASERQLAEWMKTHRVMIDLGKLLDGEILYPLLVRENPYHHSRSIPYIPEMRNIRYLTVHDGNFETGQPWASKKYAGDPYSGSFQFFDTEDERSAVIREEFDAACQAFREKPNFDTTSHTTSTTLHYGTLMEWVETHPALAIPADIEAMKAKHDAEMIEKKKAKLAAELAEMENRSEQGG